MKVLSGLFTQAYDDPTNTRRSPSAGPMSAHSLQRWPRIKPAPDWINLASKHKILPDIEPTSGACPALSGEMWADPYRDCRLFGRDPRYRGLTLSITDHPV